MSYKPTPEVGQVWKCSFTHSEENDAHYKILEIDDPVCTIQKAENDTVIPNYPLKVLQRPEWSYVSGNKNRPKIFEVWQLITMGVGDHNPIVLVLGYDKGAILYVKLERDFSSTQHTHRYESGDETFSSAWSKIGIWPRKNEEWVTVSDRGIEARYRIVNTDMAKGLVDLVYMKDNLPCNNYSVSLMLNTDKNQSFEWRRVKDANEIDSERFDKSTRDVIEI